mmetsp:Transcript_17075/g.31914  ORF Transcript_17075/g.31914 Transcript_17075/m.31914 type:complete len:90 (-) Transcript_17075:20-289(-)
MGATVKKETRTKMAPSSIPNRMIIAAKRSILMRCLLCFSSRQSGKNYPLNKQHVRRSGFFLPSFVIYNNKQNGERQVLSEQVGSSTAVR